MTKDDNPGQGAVVLNARQLILWALGVGFFGVFFAVPLRKEAIIREKLLFPSGTATAQMISILHQIPDPTAPSILRENHHDYQSIGHNRISFDNAWILKLKGLVASFTISSVYTLASYFFPKINMLPIFNWITLNWIDFCAWEWYFAPSFSYIGQGIIMVKP